MQIDTQNRDGSMAKPGMAFKAGLTPTMSQAPKTGRDAIYSGLLECPVRQLQQPADGQPADQLLLLLQCTDRIQFVGPKAWSARADQGAGGLSSQSRRPAQRQSPSKCDQCPAGVAKPLSATNGNRAKK